MILRSSLAARKEMTARSSVRLRQLYSRRTCPPTISTLFLFVPGRSAFEVCPRVEAQYSGFEQTDCPDDPNKRATLTVVGDRVVKNILSLNSSGRVSEYQLRVPSPSVHDMEGRDFIPQTDITLRRDITHSDALVLSKESS